MNIKPLYDRILVKIKSPEETTKGGIIIPDAAEAENKPQEGTVVGTGMAGKCTSAPAISQGNVCHTCLFPEVVVVVSSARWLA